MAAFKRLRPATLLKKKRFWHRCFPVNFVKFLGTPFFTELLWAATSILCGGRRLKQIEISIISRLHKENNKKIKMYLQFLFFTCCAHAFSFRASLFTKRPYDSLYS